MPITRRNLLKAGAFAGALASLKFTTGHGASIEEERKQKPLPAPIARLKPLPGPIVPISAAEYQERVARAQRLMREARPPFHALLITPGSSLYYFTGIRWWLSERLLALLLPARGNPVFLCPAFEEGRLRELLRWPIDVRIWQEDQSPYRLAAGWLAERGIRTGKVGIEETTRFVFFDGLRRASRALEYASGNPITIGCRARKSAHELALMRAACRATLDVFRAVFASLEEGMTETEAAGLVTRGFEQMGLRGDALVLFGASAALPHGSRKPETLREGELVLIDGGTTVEGYQSDITRCMVLGRASARLAQAFEIVQRAQQAALAAAVRGRACGSVDDAARKVIADAGYGPGYKYFTHRVGHGIGLDGHEHPYLVHGNLRGMEPGMTFSDEPGIYVPGEFGVRLEDDMVIQEEGPAGLLTPGFSASLEQPIA